MHIKYLKDQPIDLNGQDLLGTLPYVQTLQDIIDNSDTPFTIGLLGGWGSGKSSIIRTLEERLNKDSSGKIKLFKYDAWKYSKDSFRRTFLLSLKNFLGLDTREEFNKFYVDQHEDVDHNIHINKKWWLVAVALFPLLMIAVSLYSPEIVLTQKIIFSFVGLYLTGISFLLSQTFIEYKVSITKPHAFSPEQFEEIFRDILSKVLSKDTGVSKWIKGFTGGRTNIEKLVIVIDNIDRCEKSLALELLLTVKNFLELENIIFIVPIDDMGLEKYLQMSHHDKNEFLRKLFNATVKIKDFSPTEMFDFCAKLNKAHGLNLPTTTMSIISQEFSKNPRRIIQFINTFLTEMKLLEEQATGLKTTDPESLDALAKIVIVREEWPELYSRLLDDHKFFQRINNSFSRSEFKYNTEHKSWEISIDASRISTPVVQSDLLTLSDEQHRFFMRTANIDIKLIEKYILNRHVFNDIPYEIDNLILSQDWDSLKTQIKDGAITIERLFEYISRRLDEDVVKKKLYSTSGWNIFSLILKMTNDPEYKDAISSKYSRGQFRVIESLLSQRAMWQMLIR